MRRRSSSGRLRERESLRSVGDCRRRPARILEDPWTRGDEIGARCGERRDFLAVARKGNAGYFEHLRPPRDAFDDAFKGGPALALLGLAEHHIVGALLA